MGHALRGMALSVAVTGALSGSATPARAESGDIMVVRSDRGGLIGQRNREINLLRATGQRVELRGTCLSACTMYLSLPNVCVSPSATFGFHGPTRDGKKLPKQEFDHWSEMMARNYREPLRSWFMSKGRYRTSGYFELGGTELIRIGYPSC
jgi:hypothetical protein